MAFVPMALRGQELLSWSTPTQQDNGELSRLKVAGESVLLVPAGTGSTGKLYVISYAGGTFHSTTVTPPDALGFTPAFGVQGTDRVAWWSATGLRFYSLRKTVAGAWNFMFLGSAELPAVPDGASGPWFESAAPGDLAAVVSFSSDGFPNQYRSYFVRSGTPPAMLADGPISAKFTPQGILTYSGWSGSGAMAITSFDSHTGSQIASRDIECEWIGLESDGFWFQNGNHLGHLGMPSLAEDRSMTIDADRVWQVCALPDSGVLVQSGTFLWRFDKAGALVFKWPVRPDTRDLDVSEDGLFASDGYRLYDLTTGGCMCSDVLGTSPSTGHALFKTSDNRQFVARTDYWWDGVIIRELDLERFHWEAPSGWGWPEIKPSVLTPTTAAGTTTGFAAIVTSGPGRSVEPLLHGPLDADTPFRPVYTGGYLSFVPPWDSSSVSATFDYSPTDPGPHLAFLHLFADPGTYAAQVDSEAVATILGRTSSASILSPIQISELGNIGGVQVQYFLDPQTTNTKLGWPRSWNAMPVHKPDDGGYCVPHEIGLGMLSLAAAAERGWVATPIAWTRIELSLNSLRRVQDIPALFPDHVFYRSYNHMGSGGVPRDVPQLTHSSDWPSSDDNALLAGSLFLIDRFAVAAGRTSAATLCREIVSRINLRRFLKTDCSIAFNRAPGNSGGFSTGYWDRRGAEGSTILTLMACTGSISRDEFLKSSATQGAVLGHWRGHVFIPQGDDVGSMFIRGVRAMAGCPVTPDEYAGCTYAVSTVATAYAHMLDMAERGDQIMTSFVMSQNVGGVNQSGKAAGNEDGRVLESERQHVTGPHAPFIPLARPAWITPEVRDHIMAQIASYKPAYFHHEPGRRGFEAAVPFRADAAFIGTDAGRAYEALNSAYIVLSCYDATAPAPLSAWHPAKDLLGQAMAYLDSDVPPADDFPTAYLPSGYEQIKDPEPDFVVTGISLVPAVPTVGGTFTAHVTVRNIGSKAASGGKLCVWLDRAAEAPVNLPADKSVSIGTLKAGQTYTITLPSLKADTLEGMRSFRAFVDAKNTSPESNEANNQATLAWHTGRPDFVITKIEFAPDPIPTGKSYVAYVTVKNQGESPGDGGVLAAWANRIDVPVASTKIKSDKSVNVGTLLPGQVVRKALTGLKSGTGGQRTFRVFIDCQDKTRESDETNNQATITHPPR